MNDGWSQPNLSFTCWLLYLRKIMLTMSVDTKGLSLNKVDVGQPLGAHILQVGGLDMDL